MCKETGTLELLDAVWDCTYILTVVLLLQSCVQSGGVDAEISWGAQLHVLHQIYLDKHTHTHTRWWNTEWPNWWLSTDSVLFYTSLFVFWGLYFVLSNPVHTHLWFLWECDEVFLILLNAEDQVGDGLCLPQKFWLPREKERTDRDKQILHGFIQNRFVWGSELTR